MKVLILFLICLLPCLSNASLQEQYRPGPACWAPFEFNSGGAELPPVGMRVTRELRITEELIADTVEATSDRNPLHIDRTFAKARGLNNIVVHGALMVNLLTDMIGNDLPGPGSLVFGINVAFHRPVYPGAILTFAVEVKSVTKVRGQDVIELDVCVSNEKRKKHAAGVISINYQSVPGYSREDQRSND